MPSDTSHILEGFPHPTLKPIIGLPTYFVIETLHIQLSANAASVLSALGNGDHGLLRLTVTEAV